MQATDLLTALTINPKQEDYQGIAWVKDSQNVYFTSLEIDSHGALVLFSENKKAPLSMKELLTKLMTNRGRTLKYWDGEQRQPIYGFKEKDQLIII